MQITKKCKKKVNHEGWVSEGLCVLPCDCFVFFDFVDLLSDMKD
jgi:hypothetical protein